MAMIVAVCAARLTEPVKMKVSEIVQELYSIIFQTQTSKRKQIIKHIISFRKRIGRCCQIKTLLSWSAQRQKDPIVHDQIWHNLSKKAPATPQYCGHQVTNINRRADIKSPYTGPTIRHAMVTRVTVAGATYPEVNAFTKHVISSNDVELTFKYTINKQYIYQCICCDCLENGLDMSPKPRVSVPCAEGVVELVNLGELYSDEDELKKQLLLRYSHWKVYIAVL
ncbi:MAG: hypothetical protein EZS28_014597 [Streblomastix strix]|uniref:Uncharacterized protein n=1 Tax=Streblomastix strix TaxID=222440 RepID=A0A5J4W4F2_9EUKA|nr:MAG: hypothetical protein EZS28_014597 [Streblomastix strix]